MLLPKWIFVINAFSEISKYNYYLITFKFKLNRFLNYGSHRDLVRVKVKLQI